MALAMPFQGPQDLLPSLIGGLKSLCDNYDLDTWV